MARVSRGKTSHARHKKVLKLAKGYRGRNSTNFRIAIERVEKGLQYAYRDRRAKKRAYRRLWIARINAAVRTFGMSYSRFMHLISNNDISLNRKVLADLALNHPDTFAAVVKSLS